MLWHGFEMCTVRHPVVLDSDSRRCRKMATCFNVHSASTSMQGPHTVHIVMLLLHVKNTILISECRKRSRIVGVNVLCVG